MPGIEAVPVQSRGQMKAFIDLPWSIYQGDPNWVPPIRSIVARLLDPDRHPFWISARRELFLAMRGSDPVGRIAAVIDNNYNSYHKESMGGWGFFECANDPEAAVVLFSAVEKWARDEGMQFLRGPLNPSTNYEVGMLVQGFDSPPALGMTYNPPYYVELVHFSGFNKEKDLLSYHITRSFKFPDWAVSLGKRLAEKGEITIRKPVLKNFDAELDLLNRIYNECWARNWGFVPITVEEMRDSVKEMMPFADMDLTFFIQHKEDTVGVCFILPDMNPLLKRFNGRLGLAALIQKHRYWSEIKGLRGLIFGVKEEYRQMGVPFVAFNYLMELLKKKENYQYLELGWNLEDNQAINRFFEEGGVRPHKRHRIYRKEL
jgi:hypothetical protein